MSKPAKKSDFDALLNESNTPEARLALAQQLNKLLGDTETNSSVPAPKPQQKVIRDSFTLPENDYQLLKDLQDRAWDVRMRMGKSEILRAGLHALAKLNDKQLQIVLQSVEKLKPGRRKQT